MRGYRAGTDAVLLAAAVPARSGETVLELGCGTGVVLLCLGARVPGLELTGVERHPAYADLARRNCARNAIGAEIVEADVRSLTPEIKARSFHHVVANPPFLDRQHGKAGHDEAREGAIATGAPLSEWVAIGLRRLRPGGRLTMIAPAERLPEVLSAAGNRGVCVRPIAARAGREADRVLISASKGGRAAFRLLAPLVMHAGPAHIDDRDDDYGPEARAVLRHAATLCTTSG